MTTITETHIATVTAIQDPDKRGRIRVACVGLLGDETTEVPHWIEPALEWGWFVVPDVGEIVDIELVAHDSTDESPGQSSINTPNMRWRGRHWGGSKTDAARPIPEDFTTKNYGKRRGFATPGGHILMFDDTEGGEKISLAWSNKKG